MLGICDKAPLCGIPLSDVLNGRPQAIPYQFPAVAPFRNVCGKARHTGKVINHPLIYPVHLFLCQLIPSQNSPPQRKILLLHLRMALLVLAGEKPAYGLPVFFAQRRRRRDVILLQPFFKARRQIPFVITAEFPNSLGHGLLPLQG